MAVGVDIVIDPSGAVTGGRTAESSLGGVEKAADGATKSTSTLRDELNAFSASALTASKKQEQYRKTLRNTASATNLFVTSTNDAKQSVGRLNGFLGQAGFQISDIAIQLGNGANAASVFGIQGGQLLGFLNPLAGAIATVSGLLVGQFTGGMYAGVEASNALEESLSLTNAEINELSRAQALAAQARLSESLAEDSEALVLARVELQRLTEEYAAYEKQRADFEEEPPVFGGGFVEAFIGLGDVSDDLEKAQNRVDELEDSIASASDAQDRYKQVLNGASLSEEDATDVARRRVSVLTSLSEQLTILQLKVEDNNREAAIQSALFRSGAEAGSAYAAQVELLAGQLFDLQEQQKVANEAVKEYDKDGAYIASLENQIAVSKEAGAQQAALRAELSLSDDATAEQVARVRELAIELFNQSQATKDATASASTYAKLLRSLGADLSGVRDDVDLVTRAFDEGQITANQYAEALIRIRETANFDDLTFAESFNLQFQQVVADAENVGASLGEIYGSVFSDISSGIGDATADILVFGESGKEAFSELAQTVASTLISSLVDLGVQYAINAALGEALAAASLASTVSQAATASAAWATPAALASLATQGTNAIPAQAALTTTVASSQALAAVPAFANGGLAYGPGTGSSDSFTARLSNGEFVMPAAQTRNNIGALETMRAGGDVSGMSVPNVSIVNQTTGTVSSATAEYITKDELRITLQEEVPSLMADQVRDEYSSFNKANQEAYVTQRRL